MSISNTHAGGSAFRQVVSGSLAPRGGAQEFRFPAVEAKYVRLQVLNGHNSGAERIELAEFEVISTKGENVNLNHRAMRLRDSADLLRYTSASGQLGDWAADNIHDGIKEGGRGSWASGGGKPLVVREQQGCCRCDRQRGRKWAIALERACGQVAHSAICLREHGRKVEGSESQLRRVGDGSFQRRSDEAIHRRGNPSARGGVRAISEMER